MKILAKKSASIKSAARAVDSPAVQVTSTVAMTITLHVASTEECGLDAHSQLRDAQSLFFIKLPTRRLQFL
jgi:hypothetical protein